MATAKPTRMTGHRCDDEWRIGESASCWSVCLVWGLGDGRQMVCDGIYNNRDWCVVLAQNWKRCMAFDSYDYGMMEWMIFVLCTLDCGMQERFSCISKLIFSNIELNSSFRRSNIEHLSILEELKMSLRVRIFRDFRKDLRTSKWLRIFEDISCVRLNQKLKMTFRARIFRDFDIRKHLRNSKIIMFA